jgi:hypothetical protein
MVKSGVHPPLRQWSRIQEFLGQFYGGNVNEEVIVNE